MPRFLALDPDPTGPLIATATVGRNGIKLERVLAWPDSDPPPADPAALGAKLKELLRVHRVSAAPVLVCLPRDKVVLKDVRHPKAPPQQEPLVVRFQAKKDLAAAETDVLMDYLPVPVPAGADDCRATVVFVNKQVYADLQKVCEAGGLKLAAVTPRPFAVAAAYRRAVATAAAQPPEDPAAPVAVLSLTDRGGEFTVVHGGQVPFTRIVPASAVSGETALVGELKRSLAMYATQCPGEGVQAVYLTEGSVAGRSWSGRLQTALPIPVYPFDPTAGGAADDDLPEAVRGRFVGAVGLLAAKGESDKLPINFVSPRAPKAEPSKARTGVLLGVLALVVLAAVGGGYGFLMKQKKDREITRLQAELADLDRDIAVAAYDKKRLAALDGFTERNVPPIDLLYDITTELPSVDPKKMQLVEFKVTPRKTAPPPRTGVRGPLPKTAKGPTPRPGPAAAAAKPEEKVVADLTLVLLAKDSLEVDKFKDALKREKHFGKIESVMRGSVTGAGDRSQFDVKVEVLRWKPSEFTRKLVAAFPVKPKPPAGFEPPANPGDPDEPPFDPFNPPLDPPFDPFNPEGNRP